MSRLSKSFPVRLSSTILFITSILFLTAIMIVSYFSHKMIGEEAVKNASNVLNTTTRDINMILGKIETSVTNMEWIVYEHREDTNYMYHITRELVKQNSEIVGSSIAFVANYFPGTYYFAPYSYIDSSTDSIISKQLGNKDYDYFNMEWFTQPYVSKKKHWSLPYYDEGGGQMLMTTFSFPLFDKKGELYAIITADIDLLWLDKKITSLGPYVNSMTFLLSQDGKYISGTHSALTKQPDIFKMADSVQNYRLRILGKNMISGDSGTLRIRNDKDISFAVYGPLMNGWSTAIISPYRDVFAYSLRMNLIIIIVSAFGLFLLFIFCFRIVRMLTQPITEFSVAALNMAKGNFQARLPQINTQDEMRQLYDSFRYMQRSITHYISELRTTTAENERFESELNIARNIQMSMVPREFPERDDVSVHAFLRPAKEVGGDFYDFLIKDDVLYFVIGDVSGKGVPAALVMSIVRAAFRFLGGVNLTIDQMICKINDTISRRNDSIMFVTLFAGKIDLKTGEMYYCNAGHNPMIICHADGRTEYMKPLPNIAVGIFDDFKYKPEQTVLEKGCRLILYTDGVTEAEDELKKQFGEDRLLEFASKLTPEQQSEEVVHNLIQEVKDFTKDADQNDDITILSILLNDIKS